MVGVDGGWWWLVMVGVGRCIIVVRGWYDFDGGRWMMIAGCVRSAERSQ
jgi:hypothetical protein